MAFYTKIFIVFVVVLVSCWSAFAYWYEGNDATVSAVLLKWCQQMPALYLAIGFLLGHLFWPQR